MTELLTFFIILVAGLILSELFNRLHLPYVSALIAAGVLVGPPVLGWVQLDAVVEFLASVGLVFLMFIAGSEVKTSHLVALRYSILTMALINGLVPMVIGMGIALWLGYSWLTSLVVGIIFISSSVAVVIPMLERAHLLRSRLGETILGAAIMENVTSLLLLGLVLAQITEPMVPPWVSLPAVLIILWLVKRLMPKLRRIIAFTKRGEDLFETELRFVLVILVAAVVVFGILGIHAIVASFLMGMILGDFVRGRIEHKVRTIGYGFFVPVFFLSVGMKLDLMVFTTPGMLGVVAAIVFGSVLAKLLTGMVGARWAGFNREESWLAGLATTPHLATVLAGALVAGELGFLSGELVSAFIALAAITALATPLLMKSAVRQLRRG